MKFFCIADRESGLGFRLAGIETRMVKNRAEALDALTAARSSKDTGIILITGRAADMVRGEIGEDIGAQILPLVVEVASRAEKRERRSAGELLRQIAGM